MSNKISTGPTFSKLRILIFGDNLRFFDDVWENANQTILLYLLIIHDLAKIS